MDDNSDNDAGLDDTNIDNDICEYLEIPVCCHPEHNAGEVNEEYCLKCIFRKIPIKAKAISLLKELTMLSSTSGWYLDGTDKSKEIDEFLTTLAKSINECEQFLNAVGIKLSNEVSNVKSTRIKKSMGKKSNSNNGTI